MLYLFFVKSSEAVKLTAVIEILVKSNCPILKVKNSNFDKYLYSEIVYTFI